MEAVEHNAVEQAPSLATFLGGCSNCLSVEHASLQRVATKVVEFGDERTQREEQIMSQAAHHRLPGKFGMDLHHPYNIIPSCYFSSFVYERN